MLMSELHVSFKERDVYLDILATNYAEGRLTDEQFQKRRDELLAATTHRQCRDVLRGLPVQIPGNDQPQTSREEARPGPRRRGILIAGLVGAVGLAGIAAWHASRPDLTGAGPREPRPVQPTMRSWEDWYVVRQALEARNLGGIVDLTLEVDSVSGTVTVRGNPSLLSTIKTIDGVVVISEPASGTHDGPTTDLNRFGGGSAPEDARARFQELWPSAVPKQIRLVPGEDAKGIIEVTGTNHGKPITVKFSADGRSVLDVKEN